MRFRRSKESSEEPCPRCGIPAPEGTAVCTACGWDMNESYHADFVGSHVGEADEAKARGAKAGEMRAGESAPPTLH